MYEVGLVVGKFCPMHKGHEFLIEEASIQCTKLIILSYTSEEYFHGSTREYWLKTRFPKAEVHVLDDVAHRPDDKSPAAYHHSFIAYYLTTINSTVDAVFSSEDYGIPFAVYLSRYFKKEVRSVPIDINRVTFPISGTRVRSTLSKGEPIDDLVSPIVLNTLKPTIAILGGESSGKTTLANALAKELEEPNIVPEYGREYYNLRQGKLVYEDMLEIAKKQIQLENEVKVNKYRILDTTPLVTVFYSIQLFGMVDPKLLQLARKKYTHTFILYNDIPFVQDGTRQDEEFRLLGFNFLINATQAKLLVGSLEQRLKTATNEIMGRKK